MRVIEMPDLPRQTRKFSLDEAEALLPEVKDRLARLREAHSELAGHQEKVMTSASGNGGESAPDSWLTSTREVSRQLTWLADMSIVVRDVEQGLIDFPSDRDGKDIFLCWKMGEDKIAYWHDHESGFEGRQPL